MLHKNEVELKLEEARPDYSLLILTAFLIFETI